MSCRGDVTGLSRSSREVGIIEFGLHDSHANGCFFRDLVLGLMTSSVIHIIRVHIMMIIIISAVHNPVSYRLSVIQLGWTRLVRRSFVPEGRCVMPTLVGDVRANDVIDRPRDRARADVTRELSMT